MYEIKFTASDARARAEKVRAEQASVARAHDLARIDRVLAAVKEACSRGETHVSFPESLTTEVSQSLISAGYKVRDYGGSAYIEWPAPPTPRAT